MGYVDNVSALWEHGDIGQWHQKVSEDMANDFDITRWRSFAERYLVERAAAFEPGKEMEGIWTEVNNALSAYEHIYHVGEANAGKPIKVPVVPAIERNVETKANALTSLDPAGRSWYAGLVAKLSGVSS